MSLISRPRFGDQNLPGILHCLIHPIQRHLHAQNGTRTQERAMAREAMQQDAAGGTEAPLTRPIQNTSSRHLTCILCLLQVRRHPAGVLWLLLHSCNPSSDLVSPYGVLQAGSEFAAVLRSSAAASPLTLSRPLRFFGTKDSVMRMRE